MNRRMVKQGLTAADILERVFKCDACKFFFVASVGGQTRKSRDAAMAIEERHIADAWCPCMPWDIGAVQIGMRLPQGAVVYVNRKASIVGVVDPEKQNPEAPTEGMRELPFAEVSPPQ